MVVVVVVLAVWHARDLFETQRFQPPIKPVRETNQETLPGVK